MRKFLLYTLLFFCLTSCANLQNNGLPQHTPIHSSGTNQNWSFSGAMAARTANQAWSASLQWQQQGGRYYIALFGPLGTHAVTLSGVPGFVQLQTSDGKVFTAASPEELLAKQTGWKLPVSNLYYWVRAVPVPNVSAQKSFDASGHLVLLQQQGWTIRYLDYTPINPNSGRCMPVKIFLHHPELNIKIIIHQWQL